MLEAAVTVARHGEMADPVEPAPAPLRQFLGFAKLPRQALDVARRVLDDDADFRARVRQAVDIEEVPEAGRLFLERPDGWEADFRAAVDARAAAAAGEGEAREERRATKQLERTKGTLAKLVEEYDDVKAALAREQARARRLEDEAASHREEAERWRAERVAAVRELKVVEARDAARIEELRDVRERLRLAELAVDAFEAHGTGEGAAGEDADGVGAGSEVSEPGAAVTPTAPGDPAPDADVPPAPMLDVARAAGALGDATAAAAAMAAALAALTEEFRAAAPPAPPASGAEATGAAGPDAAAGGGAAGEGPGTRSVRGPRPRRTPTRLPLGVFDDAPQAVGALLRVPGMLVLVDGYNVSLTGWPGLDLELQRARLLDVLSGLEASTHAAFTIVFDGAGAGAGLPPESRLRSVQVRFTEPGVEADDALLAMIDQLPVQQPVTVVSSDHRVRDGAARRGANVVGSAQLLDFARGA